LPLRLNAEAALALLDKRGLQARKRDSDGLCQCLRLTFELGAAPPTSSTMRRGVLWCLNTARVAVRRPSDLHLLYVRPDSLTTSPSGFRAALDEMVSLPAIRTDIDPGTLPAI